MIWGLRRADLLKAIDRRKDDDERKRQISYLIQRGVRIKE